MLMMPKRAPTAKLVTGLPPSERKLRERAADKAPHAIVVSRLFAKSLQRKD
jgi:hypothetical protein